MPRRRQWQQERSPTKGQLDGYMSFTDIYSFVSRPVLPPHCVQRHERSLWHIRFTSLETRLPMVAYRRHRHATVKQGAKHSNDKRGLYL